MIYTVNPRFHFLYQIHFIQIKVPSSSPCKICLYPTTSVFYILVIGVMVTMISSTKVNVSVDYNTLYNVSIILWQMYVALGIQPHTLDLIMVSATSQCFCGSPTCIAYTVMCITEGLKSKVV